MSFDKFTEIAYTCWFLIASALITWKTLVGSEAVPFSGPIVITMAVLLIVLVGYRLFKAIKRDESVVVGKTREQGLMELINVPLIIVIFVMANNYGEKWFLGIFWLVALYFPGTWIIRKYFLKDKDKTD